MKEFRVSIVNLANLVKPHNTTDAVYSLASDQELTLLDIMHLLELPVRKACRNGACGVCRCQLVAGEITYKQRQPFALWQEEIAQGVILPCIAFAQSDVTLSEVSLQRPKT